MGFVLTFFCVFLSFSANAGSSEYLPYDQLLLKISSADSDVYHGKAYPVRVFNLPPAIKSCSSKDNDLKVVMMTDRQVLNRCFLSFLENGSMLINKQNMVGIFFQTVGDVQ